MMISLVIMCFAEQHLVFHSEPEQTKAEDGRDDERTENHLLMLMKMIMMKILMMRITMIRIVMFMKG